MVGIMAFSQKQASYSAIFAKESDDAGEDQHSHADEMSDIQTVPFETAGRAARGRNCHSRMPGLGYFAGAVAKGYFDLENRLTAYS
jgi:hypothetical protein